ncbi:MAG: nitrile hydratase subunit alpha [Actinomycetota bacterium]
MSADHTGHDHHGHHGGHDHHGGQDHHDHHGADGGDGDQPVAARVRELEEQLIEAGLLTDAELDEILLAGWSGSPASGAAIVAKAWSDMDYLNLLLADGNAATAAAGFRASEDYRLKVVQNTPALHNLIVCTLCSCYPGQLLGPSPAWYKSFAYRSRAVREPHAVLAEFGLELPAGTEILVWDSSAETRYLVVPIRPEGTTGLSEEALAALVTRNGLIGTAAL